MFNAWFALTFQAAQLGMEAQNVIALRLMRLADSGVLGPECRLMVTDKISAFSEAQFAAAMMMMTGNGHNAGEKVLQVLRKRVRANRNRLSRPCS